MIILNIRPQPKVRMVRSDKYKKRPCVVRYYAYCNKLRELINPEQLPEYYHIHFLFKVSDSWSNKKKAAMLNTPHQQTPDKDNLEKAFLDALFKDDSAIWDGRVSKWWSHSDCIIIEEIEPPVFPLGKNYG